jgi:predicted metalloprotease with PDZ domain
MNQPSKAPRLGRREYLIGSSAFVGVAATARVSPLRSPGNASRYRVRVLSLDPPRFAVVAELPIDGERLIMTDSYPAELPQMAAGGWPTLISGLGASDANGRPVELVPFKDKGWRLAHALSGRIRLSYLVDYTIFAKSGWPSPLESAVADNEHVAVCARALFLTTDKMDGADVSFDIPKGWHVAAPWPTSPIVRGAYRASSNLDLTDNFVVFSTVAADVVTAAGFRMQITAMGHWRPLRPLIRRTLQAIVTREVALMNFQGREAYNVVLVPMPDTGGEAYRQSFVYTFQDPSEANRATWANTMAHEIFHYWNYARLQGADYASTQWFQEGFTEYVANLTMVGSGVVAPQGFLEKLANHVANYQKLTTTLEAIGTHKGPPLYSAGALVAFSFDVMIRKASAGRRDIGTFFRNLWRYTDGGARKYAWSDIEAALRGTANLDWHGFYERHIRGREPFPLESIFHEAGLTLGKASDGSPVVSISPSRTVAEQTLWGRLIA